MRARYLFAALGIAVILVAGCDRRGEAPGPSTGDGRFRIGILQLVDSPTSEDVRNGIFRAFGDSGLREGFDIEVRIRNGRGDVASVQRLAHELASTSDLIIPISTPCLQAALMATSSVPIVFTAVAHPALVGGGLNENGGPGHVTGVASTGPIRKSLTFIRDILPDAARIGTLWTPTEINSEYYLDLTRQAAAECGLEIVAVPVSSGRDVMYAATLLINEGVDAVYQISDNTVNAAFEVLGRAAGENALPLFGGFLKSVEMGACAAMGFDFADMGYRTGRMALRIMAGEKPGLIPIQYMDDVRIHLNLEAAAKQSVIFPPSVLERAERIVGAEASSSPPASR
jgi:putative tryptophan/tyrosine transport system substrate-binding protein